MKTIKVIDLLNKIANGEEVPKKIKIGNSPFELTLSTDGKHYSGNTDSVLNNVIGMNKLNEEIEIIEPQEHKIPEKLNITNFPRHNNSLKKTAIKINEILDYLEEIE